MNKKNLFTIATGTLVGLLFFFRFYKLYEFVTFLSDQGRDAIILKRIITFEHFPAIGAPSSVGQVYLGPFYYYLVAPFLGLFNFDPVGPAIGVAILSIVGIFVAYLAVKKEVSPAVTLIFLAFSTFSTILTEYSRFSWNPNLLPYFSFMTLFFFHQWLEKPTVRGGIIFGALLGFSIQLHYLGALLGVPLALFILWKLVEIRSIKKHVKSFIAAGISFLITISPLLIFDLRHYFLNFRQFYKLFTEGGLSSGSSYFSRLNETIHGLMQHSFQISTSPLVSIVLLLAIVIIGYLAYKKTQSKFILLNLLNVIIFLIGFALLGSERIPHYYGPVILSFYLICSSLYALIQHIKIKIFIVAIIIATFVFLNISNMYFLFTDGNNQISHARKVADSFEKYVQKQPIQTVVFPHFESDGQYRYFLEIRSYDILPADSSTQPEELYIICREECNPTGDGQWQIAAFTDKHLETQWKVDGVTIYKIIHNNTEP